MSRLWEKGQGLDEKILQFTVGRDHELDHRLIPYDVRASQAHAKMLGEVGLLSPADTEAICNGLEEVLNQWRAGSFHIDLRQEDCHTAIEEELVAQLGPVGERVHLGRSRNDQVLVALRLYLKDAIGHVQLLLQQCVLQLEKLSTKQGTIAIPGYTHLQQAMPSSVSDWALGWRSVLLDSTVLLDAALQTLDQNPLGSAAGYGTPGLKLDRAMTSDELGFREVQIPSTACQSSRGKGESFFAFALLSVLTDLGRLSADVCFLATQEVGLVKLDEDVSTGSSIIPHKRNPDVFELIRGHASVAKGEFEAILAITSKLTSGYHRDYQLIKEPLFSLIDRGMKTIEIATYALGRIHFVPGRFESIADPGLFSAEEAFRMVQEEGIPFREAYRRVAARMKARGAHGR